MNVWHFYHQRSDDVANVVLFAVVCDCVRLCARVCLFVCSFVNTITPLNRLRYHHEILMGGSKMWWKDRTGSKMAACVPMHCGAWRRGCPWRSSVLWFCIIHCVYKKNKTENKNLSCRREAARCFVIEFFATSLKVTRGQLSMEMAPLSRACVSPC